VTDTYKVDLPDINVKGYLMLKYPKTSNLKVSENASYLVDKIKLVINGKGKVILLSGSKTVMIQYSMFKAQDEDSFDVNSDDDAYAYQDG
jgi:hypothetical protein